ncbi:Guanine nucleotide-binding protein G(s) subunit alpha [Echinococcus granulosus]|uniref:Adenylate cyclase-stimulating G alpha protein n=1 Tax=Echinococcus granulosus TaxID=6210 RepID=W6UJ28_ECHGR|nr:Guanine nucleotide-binding protein G(s) subunit alpha [Echinococcus granulosus]EUB58162.1 Guanine nucleotide-binding protein G(s) subunit alpha [Echinococcus granulosus]
MDCFSGEDKRRNDYFLRIMQQHGIENRSVHRILLIGTGESGKSTFVKQLKLLSSPHGTFPEAYRSKFLTEIQRNIIQALANICTFMIAEDIPLENSHSEEMVDLQRKVIKIYEEVRINPDAIARYTVDADSETRDKFFGMCASLWSDRAVRATQERGNEFQQIDSASYFLEKLNVLRQPDYLPSDKDVLQCRTRTLGIHTESLVYNGIPFEMVDVGGQREQRAKWIEAMTDGVTAVIFLTDASAYDTMLEEDHSVNRLRESYQLLGQVWTKSLLRDKSFILFLNKQDKLADKVRSGKNPILKFFPEYKKGQVKFTITFLTASNAVLGRQDEMGAMSMEEVSMEEYNEVQTTLNKALHGEAITTWPLTGDVRESTIDTLMNDIEFMQLFRKLMSVALYRTVTVTHFIKTLFLAQCEETKTRKIYPFPTTAIDKRNVIRVFDSYIPTLPNNLRLSALNQSTIFLRWKNDRQVPNSLIYEIQVTGPQNKSSSVSAAQQKLVVNGLSPYSKYFVRLTPRDPIGLGPVSLNGSVCTKPGTPTAAPNITLTSFTNTSATFNLSAGDITPLSDNSFSCPGSYKPPEHLFGPFFGFRLALEMLFFRKTINVTLINNQTESYTVEQLLPYTSYRVNVSIYNGRTFGPPSVLNFTTREGLPDPPLLQVESRSIDSLRVSLTSSDNRGVVLGYLIKWTECSNSSTVASAETEETYFAIQGLRNATCYQMQAAARTSVGLGDFSLLTQDFTSCPDFPPPTLFNISATLEGIKVSWVYADPPSSPDGNHCFLACMQSTISSICEEVTFNSTFRDNGIFSYTFPFRGVNLLGGQEIVLKFTVRSVCRPRDCKIDWPCQALGATSNVLQLDLDHLAEMFSRPAEFGELSDKAIGGIIGAVFAIFLMLCCVGALSIFYCRSSRVYKRRGVVGSLGDDFGMGCGGGDRTDDARTPLVTPKMRSFEDSPYKPIPAERLAQHVASYHVDDDAGYQAEFEAIEQSVRTSWPTSVARLPDNMAKNRYTNVFPLIREFFALLIHGYGQLEFSAASFAFRAHPEFVRRWG